jgi:Zn-dependent protease
LTFSEITLRRYGSAARRKERQTGQSEVSAMETFLPKLLFGLPSIIIALTVHEYFHGLVAFRCGDPSAKYDNRLTLNPLKHMDRLGGLLLITTLLFSPFVVGWAKPVPVSTHYLKNPRRDIILVSLAGPLSNLGLAFLAGIIYRLAVPGISPFLEVFLYYFIIVNLSLGLFNLIPCPPLDGWKILGGLVPDDISRKMQNLEQSKPMVTMLLLYIIMFSGVGSLILGPPFEFLRKLLIGQ